MKTNIKETPLKAYSEIPKRYKPGVGNYPNSALEVLRVDGWREIEEPQDFDPATQAKIDVVYDAAADRATYSVRSLTAAELEARAQATLDSDASARAVNTAIAAGSIMFQRFLTYIRRLFDEGKISGAQARNAAQLLYLPLLPLKDGQFELAKANLDILVPPTNAKELAILNKAKEQINNYLQ